jgi:hypothetical protein
MQQQLTFSDEFLTECFLFPQRGFRLVPNQHRAGLGHEYYTCCRRGGSGNCYYGSLLWDGDHVYRIGNYNPKDGSWPARWPD